CAPGLRGWYGRCALRQLVNLAILTQYYSPEVGAPPSRLSTLARESAPRGHQASLLSAMPSYPTGRRREGYGGTFLRARRARVCALRAKQLARRLLLSARLADHRPITRDREQHRGPLSSLPDPPLVKRRGLRGIWPG